MKTAEEFVKRLMPDGAQWQLPALGFHCHRDEFYRWQGSHFVRVSPEWVRYELFGFLNDAITMKKKNQNAPFEPRPRTR